MPNPFFSGRIPRDLFNKIENHISETGESKTEILVKALAAYVNHPIPIESSASNNGVSIEAFTALEKRVVALEQLLKTPTASVINADDIDNGSKLTVIGLDDTLNKSSENSVICDDNTEKLPDLWADTSEPTPQGEEKQQIAESDNNTFQPVISHDSGIKLLSAPLTESNDQDDIADNNTDNKQKTQGTLPKYESLTSVEVRELTGITQRQIDGHKRKVNDKYKKFGQPLEDRKLLKTPEKINIKKPITINKYPYDLFYIGQNVKGKDLWSVIPYDNKHYQQLSISSNPEST